MADLGSSFLMACRTTWHQNLALSGAMAISLLLIGCSEPTAEERLANATVEGTAETGFYPHCSRDYDSYDPSDCVDLRTFDPEFYSRKEQSVISTAIEMAERSLTIMSLADTHLFLNSITYTAGGSLVAVGGPHLQIARADSETDPTWEIQTFTRFADAFRDVAFRDADHGLATGYDGIIYRTLDAGEHWHVHNLPHNVWNAEEAHHLKLKGEAYAVTYADDSTAVLGGNTHMLRTTDDGQHWNPTGPGLGREAIQEIAFVDESTGWAIGSAGQVYRTRDAGANWTPVDVVGDDSHLMGLDFVGQHGCMAGSWKVWCTDDGGGSWQPAEVERDSSPTQPTADGITRLRLEDQHHGWFITRYGWIYETRDGGANWQPWMEVPRAAHGALQGLQLWGLTIADQKVWAAGSGTLTRPKPRARGDTPLGSSAILLSWPRAKPEHKS